MSLLEVLRTNKQRLVSVFSIYKNTKWGAKIRAKILRNEIKFRGSRSSTVCTQKTCRQTARNLKPLLNYESITQSEQYCSCRT